MIASGGHAILRIELFFIMERQRLTMTAKNMDDIAKIMGTMRFRKKLIGGVDEQDVWRQLDRLQKEYRSAYEAQAVMYETIMAQYGIRLDPQTPDQGQYEEGQ